MNLPLINEKFVCVDSRHPGVHGKVIDSVHIEVWPCDSGIGFFCYGNLARKCSRICFGFSKTLEGAIEVINNLKPYEGSVEE